jgi:Fe-S-cluster-containing hydrogenase component 2
MLIMPVPSIDFNECHPERCDHGICAAGQACPHKAFFQESPYDFPMHNASMCVGCGSCSAACPFKAIRML